MQKGRIGVFQVRQDWKLYADGEAARTFHDRGEAVAAGESAARAALARGFEVELHLQEPSGEFHQADPVHLTH